MSLLPSGAIETGGYDINNSLRFRRSASAYLTRTPASAGNRQVMTYSFWVKRGFVGSLTSDDYCPISAYTDASNLAVIYFNSSNSQSLDVFLKVAGTNYSVTTSQRFADPSAWYHIVIAIDTTQATASNRTKIYVNGSQVTAFSAASYVPQNSNLALNNNVAQYFGTQYVSSSYFDGYMAEVNFIDGQQLTPSSFGETDAVTGVWKAKKYTGTYGTNGFYLKFVNTISSGFSSYYGSFNGSGQYLSIASCNATNFNTGDFTVEAWVYQNSRSDLQFIVGGSSTCFQCYIEANGTLNLGKAGTASIGASTGSVPLGIWTHVAYVRSGTTVTYYINGVASGTATDSNSYNLASTTVNIATSNNNIGSYDITGNLSNVRVVKGSAVYTSNFTPPTSNLTAVTNTSILTLQNATIIDNSTNAWSITNTGSVTMTSGTVGNYSTTIASDSSGNGNNWTPNNINAVTAGTTYDAMTDSPTLTSATVANFPVLNPLSNGGATISNANLTVTANGATHYVTNSTFQIPTSGKWYWETTASTLGSTARLSTGILPNGTALSGFPYTSSNTYGWYYGDASNNLYWKNNGSDLFNITGAVNDVLQICYDADNGTVYAGKNNVFYNSSGGTTGSPSTLTNPTSTGASSTNAYFPATTVFTAGAFAINFGQRPFTYTPPTGYKALNTYNLPTPTILQGNKYMDVTLYTGNGYPTSGTQSITNAASFKPDLVWIKRRNLGGSNTLTDSVRGVNSQLFSDQTVAQETNTDHVTAFNSNGFSLGTGTSGTYPSTNSNGGTYVGWQWQAGQGTTSSNTNGSITSTVSVNTTAGFSVVTYTGTGANATVGHGLGVAPAMIITRYRGVESWSVYHKSLGGTKTLYLNLTNAANTTSLAWNNTDPTSTVFSLGSAGTTNTSGGSGMVAYCWAEIAGFSKFGSYTGNGSTDGPFVYTGFRPKFLMVKVVSTTEDWYIWDSNRGTYNANTPILYADLSTAESTAATDFLSNGFKPRTAQTLQNASGATYIYAAFAENPFKNSLAR